MGSNLLDRIDPFRGTLDDFLVHNWLLTAPVEMPGFPIAITDDATYAPVAGDLTLLKNIFDGVETKWWGVLGEQGFGKTFFSNVFLTVSLGLDVGEDQLARCAINSVKRNRMGRPETAPLVEDILKCKIIDPRKMKLNPLSRLVGMTFNEQYIMVSRMVEVTTKTPLSLEKKYVLKQALRVETRPENPNPSFPGLAEELLYYHPSVKQRALDTGLDINQPFPELAELVSSASDTHIPGTPQRNKKSLVQRFKKRLYKAAFELWLAIEQFNEGEYYSIFNGDSDEIITLMEQRAVSFDMKHVEGDFRNVIELVLGAIQMSAIMPDPDDPDNPDKPKHPERIPHFIVTDEAYTAWENSFFAEAEYVKMKTQREHGIVGMTIFHRLRDLQNAIVNPDTARKAANSLNEITVWALFRQKKAEIPSIQEFFGLPDYVLKDLTRLPKGHFWLIVPGQAPVRCMVIGTDKMIKAFNTDTANDALLERWFKTRDPKVLQEFLIKTTPKIEEEEEPKKEESGELYERTLQPV